MGPGESGISDLIRQMPDKEHRILRRRLAEHQANMTATSADLELGDEDAGEVGGCWSRFSSPMPISLGKLKVGTLHHCRPLHRRSAARVADVLPPGGQVSRARPERSQGSGVAFKPPVLLAGTRVRLVNVKVDSP